MRPTGANYNVPTMGLLFRLRIFYRYIPELQFCFIKKEVESLI